MSESKINAQRCEIEKCYEVPAHHVNRFFVSDFDCGARITFIEQAGDFALKPRAAILVSIGNEGALRELLEQRHAARLKAQTEAAAEQAAKKPEPALQ